ncbi:MAG: hypothetical protein H7236_08750 [Gemmatimonadaceae bacterium]|nr:hypothetical protein [Caulobacter sp.]
MLFAAAPPAPAVAPDARSAMVCVIAAGRRPLNFSGQLVATKPGYKPPAGTAFDLPLTAGKPQCNHLLRSKVAQWSLSVNTPGFTACKLPAPEFGYTVTYSAQAGARGLACAPKSRVPIGTWK